MLVKSRSENGHDLIVHLEKYMQVFQLCIFSYKLKIAYALHPLQSCELGAIFEEKWS